MEIHSKNWAKACSCVRPTSSRAGSILCFQFDKLSSRSPEAENDSSFRDSNWTHPIPGPGAKKVGFSPFERKNPIIIEQRLV